MQQPSSPLQFQKLLLGLLAAVLLWGGLVLPSRATDLPPVVLSYLRTKDPNVKVRFDGLILLGNGESYLPVLPQDGSQEPQNVVFTVPEKGDYPDLIQFDNNFFLLKLIQTSSGRLTLPKLMDYPIQLKEGLLPQDLLLPENLFIPVELKVLLGGLPYNPSYQANQAVVPIASTIQKVMPLASLTDEVAYAFDLSNQTLIDLNPYTGNKLSELNLDCLPTTLRLSPDAKLLFAPCLTTNELVVVDTLAHLVKTRVPVGARPDSVLVVKESGHVVVSHRFSNYLSLVNLEDLLPGDKINLPSGNGGVMAKLPADESGATRLVVADAFKPQVYVVNLTTKTVEKTLNSLPNISAIWVAPAQNENAPMEVWVMSRAKSQIQAIALSNGTELATFDVGAKPVDMGVWDNKLYTLSAGLGRLDVIDWKEKKALAPIAIAEGSFPSGMMVLPKSKRAYVTTAGSQSLYTVNLERGQVEAARPLDYRLSAIVMPFSSHEVEPEPMVTLKKSVPPPAPVANPAPVQPAPEVKKRWFGQKAAPEKAEKPAQARVIVPEKPARNNPEPPMLGDQLGK